MTESKLKEVNLQSFLSGNLAPMLISVSVCIECVVGFPLTVSLLTSKSSRNQNDSDPINEKTIPIYYIINVLSIANSNGSDNFSPLFPLPLYSKR